MSKNEANKPRKNAVKKYLPAEIELKWQRIWDEEGVYQPDFANAKRPYYNLMMFPYPSAEGLHVGSVFAFGGADSYARFKRMQGYDVFEPIGLDGFGIHSENHAIKTNSHPFEHAKRTEENFYRQLHSIGNSFAWKNKLETYDPHYYKWTQWLFTELFKAGLAYRQKSPVNYCPHCMTVLADEQVIDGKCERCDTVVEKRNLEQWFFRITEYAEPLLQNIEKLNWTEKVKIAQRNWIGKSEGARVGFTIKDLRLKNKEIEVFTTRPDTLYGATFLVLSPEHPLVSELGLTDTKEIKEYVEQAKFKSEVERVAEGKEKTGVFSGLYAINPVTGKEIPVWIADYVLMGYGTGAIMAVPAHDERDFEFAKKFDLPIKYVISPVEKKTALILHGTGGDSQKNWYPWLKKSLEELGYEVYVPDLPNADAPVLTEWLQELDQFKGKMNENSVVVGHSLGCPTAMAFVSSLKTKIQKLILVASPHRNMDWEDYANIHPGDPVKSIQSVSSEPIDYQKVQANSASIVTLFSDDDSYIPLAVKDYFEKDLPSKQIVVKGQGHFAGGMKELPVVLEEIAQAYTDSGRLINSGDWNGWEMPKEKEKVFAALEKQGIGKKEKTYHLRDWLISRQRYWGPPIPMIYCESCAKKGESWFTLEKSGEDSKFNPERFRTSRNDGWESAGWYPVPETDLPVKLPYLENYKPLGTGKSPLASDPEFVKATCPGCGGEARRETDVSDTFLDSSWYFFRYPSVDRDEVAFDKEIVKKWLPVNTYIGGAEHSVLHLLYARFITHVFKDLGYIDFDEPFARFYAHGLIIKDGAKMSKSKGNVINPDDYIKKFGADTLRTYLLFLGPFNQGGDFRDTGIEGMSRFLLRVWRLFAETHRTDTQNHAVDGVVSRKVPLSSAAMRMMHQTIKGVTEDMEELRYNTAIAKLMTWYNFLFKQGSVSKEETEAFLKLFAPFAPHMTEELFQRLKINDLRLKNEKEEDIHKSLIINHKSNSIHTSEWPKYEEKYLQAQTVMVAVQVNGKLRGTLEISVDDMKDQQKIEAAARADEKVSKFLEAGVRKVIYIPGRVLNFVVGSA